MGTEARDGSENSEVRFGLQSTSRSSHYVRMHLIMLSRPLSAAFIHLGAAAPDFHALLDIKRMGKKFFPGQIPTMSMDGS